MIITPSVKSININNLDINVIQKPGFNEVFMMLLVKCGSINSDLQLHTGSKVQIVPKGIAHFLEHIMFYKKDGEDILNQFASTGASINAFTTFDITSYTVSCTGEIPRNLKKLLEFVNNLSFSKKIIDKERKVIEQEIRMATDNARNNGFFNLLKQFYGERHSLGTPVLGTISSIAQINETNLELFYKAYYRTENMKLIVIGDIEPEVIFNAVQNVNINQNKKSVTIKEIVNKTTMESPFLEIKMPISQPQLFWGYRDSTESLTESKLLKHDYLTKIGLELISGKSSLLYQNLYNEKLIGKDFFWSYEATPSYAYSALGGISQRPDLIINEWDKTVQKIKEYELDELNFQRARYKIIGRVLELFDSPSKLCRNVAGYLVNGLDFFDILPILETININEVQNRLLEHLAEEKKCSFIYPIKH
ncbi:EF-P 5-aminopentanol modification-associated protein YfmH [Priestia megaterium]|uniref:EF-P 5-aminopentanol modification-associated protein YfmH n=1 Tax=Priestia megaterium TaxID=1404 RepID=UPI00177DBA93|nr:pitrilysin family protein [Priestia megaterium]MBD8848015.1 insulinase family protein [Priestia megaterium]